MSGTRRWKYSGLAAALLLAHAVSWAFTLDKENVRPRILTPNGDGLNDAVVFQVVNDSLATLKGRILDMTGGEVATLRLCGTGCPTSGALIWDGRDDEGRAVPAGVYIYEITGEGQCVTGAVMVAR